MSNAFAAAAVTAVLKDILDNTVVDNDLTTTVGSVTVSALPPDRIDTDATDLNQLNLFLYLATPNQSWRNADLPSHDARGKRVTNHALALDLHYLLTAYNSQDLFSELLLGYGMQALHESPVLSRDRIQSSWTSLTSHSPQLQAITKSGLAEQIELIKIWPQSLSIEEISKLWAATQATYRPTAAYQASVVLIEQQATTRASLPVRARNVYLSSIRRPVIKRVVSSAGVDRPIIDDGAMLVQGYNLKSESTAVTIDGADVPSGAVDIGEAEIGIRLDAIPAGALTFRAGAHGVQVAHRQMMGTPHTEHRGVESNAAAFVLHPRIVETLSGNDDITVSDVSGSGDEPRSATIEVGVSPSAIPAQRIRLLLNGFLSDPVSGEIASSLVFAGKPREDDQSKLSFQVSGVEAGTYLVRVQVDGAESALMADKDPNNPKIIRFLRPAVTIS